MAVRHRVLALLKSRGISQAELARRMGEQPQWVNRRLNPKPGNMSTIEADEVPRFANALAIPCSQLFVGSECPDESALSPENHSRRKVPLTEINEPVTPGDTARRPAAIRPTSREDRLVGAMMASLMDLTPDDLDAARRVLDAMEQMLEPPEPPDEGQERTG